VITIPSWLNEKAQGVGIGKCIWTPNIMATVVYILLGILGAKSFYFPIGDDLINTIDNSFPEGPWSYISKITAGIFPILALLTTISVFAIIVRYNLLKSGLCGLAWANFWAVIFPWLVAIPFSTGTGLINFLNWVGLIVNGYINFIVPLTLYFLSQRLHERHDIPMVLVNSDMKKREMLE